MDRARVLPAIISLALLGATLEPLRRQPYDDGFPLSTYPMFASRRQTVQTYHYALGETAAGERRTLAPIVVGTGEILQALRVIERAAAGGVSAMTTLCHSIAARVAAYEEFAGVVTIRIVRGTHDAVEYLVRDQIGREIERARCTVPR